MIQGCADGCRHPPTHRVVLYPVGMRPPACCVRWQDQCRGVVVGGGGRRKVVVVHCRKAVGGGGRRRMVHKTMRSF